MVVCSSAGILFSVCVSSLFPGTSGNDLTAILLQHQEHEAAVKERKKTGGVQHQRPALAQRYNTHSKILEIQN